MKKMIHIAGLVLALSMFASCNQHPAAETSETTADTASSSDVSGTGETAADKELTDEPDYETFEAYMRENDIASRIASHGNVQVDTYFYVDEKQVGHSIFYQDSDISVDMLETVDLGLLTRDKMLFGDIVDGEEQYVIVLFDDSISYSDFFDNCMNYGLITFVESETLIETSVKDDGTFVAVSEQHDPNYTVNEMRYYDSMGIGFDVETAYIRFTYVFNNETHDILSVEMTFIGPDEEIYVSERSEYSYGIKPYDIYDKDGYYADYLNALDDPEKTRNVTLIFAPGTEDESVLEYTVVNYTKILVTHQGVSMYDLYTDPECTAEYDAESDNGTDDLTLYITAVVE
ncbi:MAG: hypothetical protein J6Z24_06565 [Oscillospiraceae bacterium]|nr:hypothetical protein [Oscillospiraceae bacterium]